jgi:hypothetical protein
MMTTKELILTIAIFALLFGGIVYQAVAFHTYPCEAFKRGHLSWGYAPSRCIL